MKVTQMPPVHAANLVANSGNTAYGVDVIEKFSALLALCEGNPSVTGGFPSQRPVPSYT